MCYVVNCLLLSFLIVNGPLNPVATQSKITYLHVFCSILHLFCTYFCAYSCIIFITHKRLYTKPLYAIAISIYDIYENKN